LSNESGDLRIFVSEILPTDELFIQGGLRPMSPFIKELASKHFSTRLVHLHTTSSPQGLLRAADWNFYENYNSNVTLLLVESVLYKKFELFNSKFLVFFRN
jgi:hypothetical protein